MGDFTVLSVSAAEKALLEQCFRVRRIVFCDEQGVSAALEWDGLDETCDHFLASDNGVGIGTARVRVYAAGVGKIERVAVLASERGRGIGRALMDAAITHLRRRGLKSVMLNAQTAVRDFYVALGFVTEGDEFVEADIPHVRMTLKL